MERFTISLDDALAEEFDAYIQAKGYSNRSEAMRDLIRAQLEHERLRGPDEGQCIAALSYVFNHHERELARRLTEAQHHHHDLGVATLHTHLDHDHCLEISVLRGPTQAVKQFADQVIAQSGVRHGHLHQIPAEVAMDRHHHGEHAHPHVHSRPKT